MKVAIITSGFLPVIDGVTVSGLYRVQRLSQWGHEVLLFCPDYSAIPDMYPNWQEYSGDILPGVRVVNLASTGFMGLDFERNVSFFSYKTVLAELKRFQPDIVHVDEPERLFLGFLRSAGIDYAKTAKIPCFGFYRTNFIDYLEDFFPLPPFLFSILQNIVKQLILMIYNSYDVTLVTSPITHQKIIEMGIRNTRYANLVGFESKQFTTAQREPNFFTTHYQLPDLESQIKLVFVGRLTPDKGWDFTLNAMPQLLAEIGVEKVAFIIAGDGSMRDEIQARLSQLTPYTYILGRVPPENIPALLINSDIHITTSEKEARGLTILEAFAAGIPVVAANAGGVVENIQPGKNGFLFEPGDPDDFVSKVKTLVNTPNLRLEMGEYAKTSISSYDWDHAIQNLVDVWQSEINRSELCRD